MTFTHAGLGPADECFDVCHDWHYLLRETGLLSWDTTLAGLVRLAAFALLWTSVASGAWMAWRMTRDDGSGAA